MLPFYKKYSRTIFDIALLLLTGYLFMLLFSYIYGIAKPIFWSFIIFLIIEPFARFLHKRKFKKIIATTISTLLFILIILAIIAGAGVLFTNLSLEFIMNMENYKSLLQDNITHTVNYFQNKIEALPPDVMIKIQEFTTNTATKMMEIFRNLLNILVTFITSISGSVMSTMINLGMALILAFFLSVEIDNWKRIAKEKTPSTFKTAFEFLRVNVIKGIVSYVKSQFKLVSITFAQVFISFLILGVKNAFALALLCGLVDILPLLGVSAFFIPWITYSFIVGDTVFAIWLTVILAIVLIVRQILEPKITGESLGVSAFTMLCAMIISLSLFGVMGLIMSPIIIILVKALYDQGYLQRWIRMPKEEYPEEKVE
ncbi:sporulation integral membrane protein YtvI [Paenibacillus albiflavus]|uniref:Sporulation integral membrane protein YtvI n=1 Tax=Paenibacillus albiflavus TaxID=2545760 RepID=A0A4R4E8Z1_9BACL|nr:sporulation integral membrane protein YtvI [Paenibacillus albiflavus]TCZ74245.1 sporulation integral membrane protein YtvI [Paenibacillus albiflavus]